MTASTDPTVTALLDAVRRYTANSPSLPAEFARILATAPLNEAALDRLDARWQGELLIVGAFLETYRSASGRSDVSINKVEELLADALESVRAERARRGTTDQPSPIVAKSGKVITEADVERVHDEMTHAASSRT